MFLQVNEDFPLTIDFLLVSGKFPLTNKVSIGNENSRLINIISMVNGKFPLTNEKINGIKKFLLIIDTLLVNITVMMNEIND